MFSWRDSLRYGSSHLVSRGPTASRISVSPASYGEGPGRKQLGESSGLAVTAQGTRAGWRSRVVWPQAARVDLSRTAPRREQRALT